MTRRLTGCGLLLMSWLIAGCGGDDDDSDYGLCTLTENNAIETFCATDNKPSGCSSTLEPGYRFYLAYSSLEACEAASEEVIDHFEETGELLAPPSE